MENHEKLRNVIGRFLPVMVMLSLLVLCGCSSKQAAGLPPITASPTGQHQVGKFVWFDLLTEDVKGAQYFYSELFGWRFKDKSADYTVIYFGDNPIGGIVPYESKEPEVLESFWMASLSVENVDRAVSATKARYGKVLDGPMDVKGRGKIAVIRDPEGAELVLIRTAGGDPVDKGARAGEWLWVDLFTRDLQKANDFYGALAGYTAHTVEKEEDHSYNLLRKNGRAYAGVVELPWDDVEPNWMPYVGVDDLEDTISRVEKLGGIVILRLENVAVIADPGGGVLGVQEIGGSKS